MCGLVGFLGGQFQEDSAVPILEKMSDMLIHRGPDDAGAWFDAEAQVGLGHRRLSIIDLSSAGHQPMSSSSGRYVLVLNGEIYNYKQLREILSKSGSIQWKGHSDTETLLGGFDSWGIQATIERAVGMFAFAVWDKKERRLILGRDRLGEKPLFYGWQQGSFLFASGLKAVQSHPAFKGVVNRDALALLMRHNTIPAPYCIWQGMHKLEPGCLLSVSRDNPEPVITTYWSGKKVVEEGIRSPFKGSAEDAVSALDKVLSESIRMQMVADVPVGAFLSGGVDSSTVVALMQAQSSRAVRSFSIGYQEAQYNEAEHAKAVAKHLGTEHTELYITPNDALSVIPKLADIYDEPFSDSSQIPTFLVSQLAKQQVTVSLSGDGGDELFGGYNRYLMVNQLWRMLSKLPLGLRRVTGRGIMSVSPGSWNRVSKPLMKVLPRRFVMASMGDKLHKGAAVLASQSVRHLYRGIVSHWQDPASVVLGATEPSTLLTDIHTQTKTLTDIEYMMALDMLTYLPDDILTKVDRAAMGVSLETRVPLLDHRVVEFAWSLPLEYKLRNGVGKWALREVLYKHVPKQLIERPKMGFGVPIDSWLRGPLKAWAETLLNEKRLKEEGFFDVNLVRNKWKEHLSGRCNWQYLLWDVLMFQHWMENNQG
ncbi:MAG: asparagine synthase (glutamine-hydrolyzing) [Gammaproteobacteria bacterium]|nr:asparagine synthase (glutamine-hydrolyzing) [Gammaproteobacteria bacterium]